MNPNRRVLFLCTDSTDARPHVRHLLAKGWEAYAAETMPEALLFLVQAPVATVVLSCDLDDTRWDSLLKGLHDAQLTNQFLVLVSVESPPWEKISDFITGYLPCDATPAELEQGLTTMLLQGHFLDGTIWQHLRLPVDRLGVRELEVLTLLLQDRGTKEIATECGITFDTANNHRRNIRDKLGIRGGKLRMEEALRPYVGMIQLLLMQRKTARTPPTGR